jgi:formylglycine-generating enzyme required for sulfatase activity
LANSGSTGIYETGWLPSDNTKIAPTEANLTCSDGSHSTWTSTAGNQENLPINCVNWYEAYAFCIWDGGFLPSEAEWEYAAAGGGQQREYPWGSTAPGTACPGSGCEYAIYNCDYPSGSGRCAGVTDIAPVGTASMGAGAWGQLDLAGELWEWNLDWYQLRYVEPCANCAKLSPASNRVVRGADFSDAASLEPTTRKAGPPSFSSHYVGFRCARAP